MKSFKRMTGLILALLAVLFLSAGWSTADAQTRTLTLGKVSGVAGAEVVVPVTIDNPADIGGVAFTIAYDAAIFEFLGIEQAATGAWVIKDPELYKAQDPVLENVLYYNPYQKEAPYADRTYATVGASTLFFVYNVIKDGGGKEVGRVLVAGGSADPLTGTALFQARFKIKAGVISDTYPVNGVPSIVNNAAAGYTADTLLPVLVGVGPKTDGKYTTTNFPVIPSQFVAGAISVSTGTFRLGGKVTYGTAGGAAAAGSTVTLRKYNEATQNYAFNDETAVGTDGLYSFAGKPAGKYRLAIRSNDPGYNDYTSPADIDLTADKTNEDVILEQKPQPQYVTGTVTQGAIPGLLVKVVDSTDKVMGIYSVNSSDGKWTSALLPAGTYNWYLVYGSLESAKNATTFDTNVLKSIGGTLAGLPATGGTVTVSSEKGRMTKSLSVQNGAYSVNNLVAADDYIASAVGAGYPVTYYNNTTDVMTASPVNISQGNATGIDFTFVPPVSHITGKISEGTTGVGGLTVYGFEVNSYALVSATTGPDGAFDLTVQKGSYEVFVVKGNGKIFYFFNEDGTPTMVEANAQLRNVTADSQTIDKTNIDILECDKTLTGRVTFRTAGGDPAPNVLISAFTSEQRAVGLTGQDGKYAVGGLCNGTVYSVEMKNLSGNYPVQTASITAGTDTVKDFIIGTGTVLSGKITDSGSGAGVGGALLYLKNASTGALVGGRIYFSATDGTYSIKDIEAGSYILEVAHADYRSYTGNLDIGAFDVTLNVALEKGAHFKGKVTDSGTTKALNGATVIVTRSGDAAIYTVSNSAGNYSVYGLDATKSDYTLFAQIKGYERKSAVLQQPATAGTTVDFPLVQPTTYYKVSGTVTTTPGGAAVAGAQVLVSSQSKKIFLSTVTGSDGKYTVEKLLPAADYELLVIPAATNLPLQTKTFAVTNADVTQDMAIPLGTSIGGTITGSTAFPSGLKVYVFLFKGSTYRGYVIAGADGKYLFSSLDAANDYKVLATAAGYTPQWYNGKTTVGTADAVDTTGGDQPSVSMTLSKN